ncbi:MAG: hypothetical protein K8S94_15895 [Planctomycetia bacterium]|nr:hypothetical protein [Planctomycetia bacterium]
MNDMDTTSSPAPGGLFVIACPTCFGHVAASAGMAGQPACCPLCAASFVVPVPQAAPPPPPRARPTPQPVAIEAAATPQEEPQPTPLEAATPPTELQFQEPVKTVGSGANTIELRRLTDEERRIRRGRRNILLLLVGAAILMIIVMIFGTPRRKR